MQTLAQQWQSSFWESAQQTESAALLRNASIEGRLGDWTTALTAVTVATCNAMGWQASAKGHALNLFPVSPSEYLAIDVMAFPPASKRWQSPIAVLELENSLDSNRSAYALWKVLCVRATLRVVFCYRRTAQERSALVSFLRDEVVKPMSTTERMSLAGQTLLVVGSREDSVTFPYGFFKWWELQQNTGTFNII